MVITTRSLADAYPRPDVSFVTITDLGPVTYGVAWRETESRPVIQLLVDPIDTELTTAGGRPAEQQVHALILDEGEAQPEVPPPRRIVALDVDGDTRASASRHRRARQ